MSRDVLMPDPDAQGGGLAAAAPPSVSGGLRDLSAEGWTLLRSVLATAMHRRLWLAVAFAIPVAAALAAIILVPERFTAQTLIVVSAGRENSSANEITGSQQVLSQAEVQKQVQSEIDLMTSGAVERRVFERLVPAQIYPSLGRRRLFGLLPPASEERQRSAAANLLRGSLLTEAQLTSSVVRLYVSHVDRATSVVLLNAVLQAYLELRNEVFTSPAANVLSTEVERQATELREVENEITALKSRVGVLDIAQEVTLASQRLDGIVRRLDTLREQREAAQAAVVAAQTAIAGQPARVLAGQDLTNLSPNDEARNTLARLMQDRQRMAVQYQPNAPMMVELDGQIARAQAQLRESRGSNFQTERQVRNPAVEMLTTRLLAAQVDAQAIRSQEQEVRRQRAESEERNLLLLSVQRDLRVLERRREAQEQIYRQFVQREATARLSEEARLGRGASVSVAQRPFASAIGRSLTLNFLAAGLLGGIGFVAAAAFVLTLVRRTWLSPEEAERGTGLPALGQLPAGRWSAQAATTAPAIAGLAAQLLDAGLRGRVQILQFLGTGPRDERDRLTRSLAVELARTQNKRVLLVDLDGDGKRHFVELGDPEQPPVPSDEGILAHETMVPRLWIAYQARDSDLAKPHALETNVTRLADRLRLAFDLLLIIGPDEMESYARRRLSVIVDGNILVVHEDDTRSDTANAMIDRVQASGGRFFGLFYTGATPAWSWA